MRDITATEKLLRSIRSQGAAERAAAPVADPPPPPRRRPPRFRLPAITGRAKSSAVGIDIGPDGLRLVRAARTAGGQWRVGERRHFALPPGVDPGSPGFAVFLRESLVELCGSPRLCELWVLMPSELVDIRHIRIPRVPRRQVANVVYWTVKKETPFDDGETLLDFETQGEVVDQGIAKLAVMVYLAPRAEVGRLRELFAGIGWPLTGISTASFAMQNLFRTGFIPVAPGATASVYIGEEFSQIDIFSGKDLTMTRAIKAGLSSMVESLLYRFNEREGPSAEPVLSGPEGWRLLQSLGADPSAPAKADRLPGCDREELFAMIQPPLERLARQVARTFEHFATTTPGDAIARVYISAAMDLHRPLVDFLGERLGIESGALGSLDRLETAADPELDDAEGPVPEPIAFGPALGLALSGNGHTPNMLFTYRDKEKAARVIRINRAVFALFIAAVLLCGGVFAFQNHSIAQKRGELAAIGAEAAGLGRPVSQEELLKLAAGAAQRQRQFREYAERYLNVIVISELAALTPPGVRFLELRIQRGPAAAAPEPAKEKGRDGPGPSRGEVTLEGLILGEREQLEIALAGYAMTLEASPLFRSVTIQKSGVEPYLKGETLRFTLQLKIEASHG